MRADKFWDPPSHFSKWYEGLSYSVKRTGHVGNHSSQFSAGRAVPELYHVRGRMRTGRAERVAFHTIVISGFASRIV